MPSVVFYVWISMMLIGVASLIISPLLYVMFRKPHEFRNLSIAGSIVCLIISIGCGCNAITEVAKQSEEGVWKLPFENYITYLFDMQVLYGAVGLGSVVILGVVTGFLHSQRKKTVQEIVELELDVE